MIHANLLFMPTLVVAIALFAVGLRIARNIPSIRLLVAWIVLAMTAAVPAVLFVAYYGHLLDNSAWFYAFRARPYSELSASGAGLAGGMIAGLIHRLALQRSSALFVWIVYGMQLLCLGLLLFAPYVKPLLAPIRIELHDQWRDGVCIQSTPSTCGPSSAATILKLFGLPASERELAGECFSYGGGTENWYVARALRRRGLDVEYVISGAQPAVIPFPSIAGTQIGGPGGAGHFIAILGREDGSYLIGDPIFGKRLLTADRLRSRYYLTGFFLVARNRPLR